MISVVILTKNEEKNIKRCLKSLLWCDETIIIDDYSSDNTSKLARQVGAKVFRHSLNDDFAQQRNFGLSKAKGEWVLFVDADEIVTNELAEEIEKRTIDSDVEGFLVRREYYFLGKKITYGEIGQTFILRLGKRKKGKWRRAVHEEWNIKGKVERLGNPLLHFSDKGLKDFIADISKYSQIHAQENIKEGKKARFLFVILYPLGKFFVSYFVNLGFLDGTAGFVLAVFMSFHSFLAWARIWLILQKQKEYI